MKDGRLRMTLKVADTDELVSWILSFGSQVKVISPESLQTKVRGEARRIRQVWSVDRIYGSNPCMMPHTTKHRRKLCCPQAERIEQSIFIVRGLRVMLSTHLAALCHVEPRALAEAVKRVYWTRIAMLSSVLKSGRAIRARRNGAVRAFRFRRGSA